MIHLSDFRIDSRIQRLAGALAERGDEVDLICIGERDELRVGEGVIRIHPVRASKPSGGARAYLGGYGAFLIGAMARLTSLDLRQRFDVIEAHNMPDLLTAAALVPRLRGTPVILNVHDTFPELFATKFKRAFDGPAVRLIKLEERCGAALAARLVTVTSEARDCLAARGVGVGRTIVVMNSPDERVFGPARPPRQIPEHGPIRLIYNGGLAGRFGVETLIRAVGKVCASGPHVSLRICGVGDERERLAALADEVAPGDVDFAPGPVPFERIPAELLAAHIGVVPTHEDRFTRLLLPVKLLECVHTGLPVVASRLPGIARYFSAEELTMFTPGNSDALAAAIGATCANPDAARERALRASQRLQGMAWSHQRARYLALVDALAGSKVMTRRPALMDAPSG
jgi:glycosyltransferase involved in cell wall biosynthesis